MDSCESIGSAKSWRSRPEIISGDQPTLNDLLHILAPGVSLICNALRNIWIISRRISSADIASELSTYRRVATIKVSCYLSN